MAASAWIGLRRAWRSAHRWIGIGAAVLLVPIGLSGSLLVWHDGLDGLIHPDRYAVSGAEVAQPASAYLAGDAAALPAGLQPAALRYPERAGAPVTVMARGPRQEGVPPRILTVYLDPPTARVLDIVDVRASLIGLLHRFHENLTMPDLSGRQIVGWGGVHEGSHVAPVWQVLVFLTGLAPTLFAVTGVIMWLRGRRSRRAVTGPAEPSLQAAE